MSTFARALSAALLFACAWISAPGLAHATTIAGGNIINQTWTPAGNPYVIQGDITIPVGSTLTIQPGVVVQVAASDAQVSGMDTSHVEIVVNGAIAVNGTAAMPVSFAAQSGTAAGTWYGIVINAGATSATFAYTSIAHAATPITSAAPGTVFAPHDLTITTCSSAGLNLTGGTPMIDNLLVTGCYYGVFVGASQPVITHAQLYGNSYVGVYAGSATANVAVSYSTIVANGSYGVRAAYGTATVTNCVITATGYGLIRDAGATLTESYNDVWSNTTNYSGVSIGAGSFSANPLFVGAPNYRLTSRSPARFASSGGTDIGALPFTTDATTAMVGTLWVDTTISAGVTNIPGDLTVAPGVTLTILPGATLQFANGDLMAAYADTSHAELRVQGTLTAVGTSASNVTFGATGTAAGTWYGIVLMSSSTGSVIDYAIVEEAGTGILHSSTAPQTIRRTTIRTCSSAGLNLATTSMPVDAITVTGCYYGVFLGGGNVTLTNPLFYANSYVGAYVGAAGATLTLTQGTLVSNGSYGVRAAYGTATVTNSIITGTGYGLIRDAGATLTASYNDVWSNTTNYSGVSIGTGSISVNPQFVSASDYHLMATSVAIDVGTATGAPSSDHDGVARPLDGDGIGGAGYDMGAFEYVRMAICGDGILASGEVCDDGAQNGTYGHCNASCSGQGPRCGDGMTNGPEACDDGNASNTDACLNTCALASCGDGFAQAGVEQCDDGNAVTTDACILCTSASCGDGYLRAGVEQCDDGNASSTDACVMCHNAVCGDGYTRAGVEQCDDGNMSNVDACTNVCLAARCGDGYVGPGEQCDDGNMVDNDVCSNSCRNAGCGDGIVQSGEQCDDGNMVNDDACSNGCTTPRCGDGIVQSGEQCDDGNAVNDDTCSNTCRNATCGDGILQPTEQCDDGNTDPSDACTATCRTASCGDGVVRAGVEQCDDGNGSNDDACIMGCVTATCGDGYLHTGVEACDDGNRVDTDGCNNACALVSCGDGMVQTGEQCDDGNTSNLDGCLNTCLAASCGDGFRRVGSEACDDGNADDTDACTSTCHTATCGDGFVHAGVEQCDDGNGLDTDACLVTCTSASCGDGFVEDGVETCDDANTTPGDGCSASCMTEMGGADGGTSLDAGVQSDAGVTSDAGGLDAGQAGTDAGGGGDGGVMGADGGGGTPPSMGGCGCAAAGRGESRTGLAWLGLALGAILVARRRRAV